MQLLAPSVITNMHLESIFDVHKNHVCFGSDGWVGSYARDFFTSIAKHDFEKLQRRTRQKTASNASDAVKAGSARILKEKLLRRNGVILEFASAPDSNIELVYLFEAASGFDVGIESLRALLMPGSFPQPRSGRSQNGPVIEDALRDSFSLLSLCEQIALDVAEIVDSADPSLLCKLKVIPPAILSHRQLLVARSSAAISSVTLVPADHSARGEVLELIPMFVPTLELLVAKINRVITANGVEAPPAGRAAAAETAAAHAALPFTVAYTLCLSTFQCSCPTPPGTIAVETEPR
jgi:hypothetical protein